MSLVELSAMLAALTVLVAGYWLIRRLLRPYDEIILLEINDAETTALDEDGRALFRVPNTTVLVWRGGRARIVDFGRDPEKLAAPASQERTIAISSASREGVHGPWKLFMGYCLLRARKARGVPAWRRLRATVHIRFSNDLLRSQFCDEVSSRSLRFLGDVRIVVAS